MYTDLLFHPLGVSFASHNIPWLNIAAWLPLQAMVGGNAGYSLIFIATFALNGFSMYLLAREFTGSPVAAFIGGLVYGFWPYTLSHYGHPNMMPTGWIPLTLLYLQRTLDSGDKRDALIAALFLALTGLTSWHLLIMEGGAIGLFLLYRCLRDKACRTRRTLGNLLLTGFVAGVLMAPPATPVIVAYLSRAHPADYFTNERAVGQTDLLAYVLPTRGHPLWGDMTAEIYENFIDNKVYVAFLGYTTMALMCYGAVKCWRQARFWLLVAVAYVALALGPQLRVNGQLYPQVPMPYRLVEDTAFIRLVRKPDRLNVILGIPVGMLASLGATALLRHRLFGRNRRLGTAVLVVAASTLILREYCLAPYPTARTTTPAWYSQLAQEPGRFAVLDLPMGIQTFDKHYMFYQITHGKRLVEGHISRVPAEAFAFIDSVPLLSQLRQNNTVDPALVDVSRQVRTLAEADIHYIILHKNFASPEQLAAWQDWLTFEPRHEDADLIVYSTGPRLGTDFTLAHRLDDEIGLIRAAPTPPNVIQGGLLQVDTRWGSGDAGGRDYDVCLSLGDASGEIGQTRCGPLSATWPTSQWNEDEIVRGFHTLLVDPFLQPGPYTVSVSLMDSDTGVVTGHPASIGSIQVDPLRPTHPLEALWGDVILLHGYDLNQSEESLELTLYWQARHKMNTSYKIFVHLIDPDSGAIVTQDDAVPRRWTYATTEWQRDEVVRDVISLSLDGVPPGRYRLWLGLYDQATGERLAVYAADRERYSGDAVSLTAVDR